jgi:hypothetical protein
VNKKLNQPKDKISTISMTIKIMKQIDKTITAHDGLLIKVVLGCIERRTAVRN